ncbi:MAG: pyruvate formate-lyase-activating protein [Clostridia bacterium]
MTTAKIHSYESLATLDGDGVRFAVFLSGCPLRCVYCHNPDTWSCFEKELTVEQFVEKVRRYKPYFSNGGGVTFSGGEPLLQAEFIAEVSPLLAEKNISYALDTSGAVDLTDEVEKAVDGADLVILDLKFWDNASYKKYTGGDIQKVINFGDYLQKINKRVWLRTVIVPDINDSEALVDKYLSISSRWQNVEKYELLAFHTLGFSKYENLGIANPLKTTPPLSSDTLTILQNYLNSHFQVKHQQL